MDIYIWGCNEFSELLYNFIKHYNLKILGFINRKETSHFCGLPVYSAEEFKQLRVDSNIPIVLATPHNIYKSGRLIKHRQTDVNFESIRQFKIYLQEIIHEHNIENPILHPAALVDLIPVNYPNKIISFGLAGSGNTIFNHLLQKLSESSPKFTTTDPLAVFFEKLCFEYAQIIHQVIGDVAYSQKGHPLHVGPWKIGTTQFNYFHGKQLTVLHTFATRDHIICRNYGYHVLPTPETLARLQKHKFNLFFIIRNPLDIIVSLMNKKNAIDRTTKEVKLNFFHNASTYVIKLLTLWHKQGSKVPELRYDDLIQSPVNYIEALMKHLGMYSCPRQAQTLWKTLGFKELPAVPANHFWSGGNGKWVEYLTPEHLHMLKEAGMEEILANYNYHDTLKTFREILQSKHPSTMQPQRPIYLPENRLGLETISAYDYLLELYGDENCIKQSGSLVACTRNSSKDNLKAAAQAMNNPYIEKLILAGAHPDYRVS